MLKQKFGLVLVLYGDGASKTLARYSDIFKNLEALGIPVSLIDHGGHNLNPDLFKLKNVIYRQQDNKGFGFGLNVGCKTLFEFCQYAIVLNPDLGFSLEELLNIGANLSAPFSVIETEERGRKRSILFFSWLSGVITDKSIVFSWPFFNGAAFCIERNLFERTNGFDEKYFLYFEDVDFSFHLRRLSIPLHTIKSNSFVHEVGGCRGKNSNGMIEKAAACSALRLVWKWFPWNIWLYFRYSLKWLLAGLRRAH